MEEKFAGWKRFVAAVVNGGRDCAANSFILSMNLNMNIGIVEFFVLKWLM